MTYDTLVTLITKYLENEEQSFVDNLPDIIRTAEGRIYNSVRTPDQRITTTGSVSTATLTTPGGFVEPLGLYFGASSAPALPKSPSYIRTVWSGITGRPEHYAVLTQTANSAAATAPATFLLGPTPDTSYDYTLDYIGVPTSITAPATPSRSTWLSINFPDVLLYGCLVEGYVYNKGQADMMAEYKARYEADLQNLRRSAEGLLLQDEYRDRPVGREVTL